MGDETSLRRVCLPWGFVPTGRQVRAVCSCGFRGAARVDDERARNALLNLHGVNQPVCHLCGKDHSGHDWEELRRYVGIMTDPATGDRFLVCRDMPRACRDGAAQRQLRLDRAAADELGASLPRPTLRLLGGGSASDRRGSLS